MGRPRRTDAERVTHARLLAPRELTPAQGVIWARDIASMPANFFVPADIAALRTYVDVVAEYERIHRALLRATGDERRELAKEFRAITALRVSCMRALRMLPHSRLGKSQAANLANDPTLPEGVDALPPHERWKLLLPPRVPSS